MAIPIPLEWLHLWNQNTQQSKVSRIIVYEHGNFQGMSKEFTYDVPNLNAENFNDNISSMKVIGNPWVVYTDCSYSGEFYAFEEGEYADLKTLNDSISSLEMVRNDLSNPQITLYENSNYGGRSVVLTGETYLGDVGFNDTACSHKVQRGVWVLYEHGNRGGARMITRPGDSYVYNWWSKKVSHVQPLRGGE